MPAAIVSKFNMEDQYLLEGLRAQLDSISRVLERVLERALEPDMLDSTTLQMELLYSHLIRIHDRGQCCQCTSTIIAKISLGFTMTCNDVIP